ACRLSRRLGPLSEPLESGQTVEIITAPGTQPNPAWLSFVVTGKARSNIRHFLKNQRHSESVSLGKRLLNKVLGGFGTQLEKIPQEQIQKMLQQINSPGLDNVLEDIGLGNRMAHVVGRLVLPEHDDVDLLPENAKESKQS